MPLALFDLDHTLLNGDSDHSWGAFLAERGLVDPDTYAERSDYYFAEYLAGRLDIHDFLRFQLTPLVGGGYPELVQLRAQYVEERIRPMVTDDAKALVEHHRGKGDRLVIITATNNFITRPIADLFGIEHLIATELEMIDGVFTGRIIGEPCFREGKVAKLKEWLSRAGGDLSESWFYTDSQNDLPLLECVDHPVAVNPDAVLEQEAQRRNWPIRRF